MERIYLDHAATTPLDAEVLEKMLPYFTENFGNADSPHALGRKAMQAVDSARDSIAARIGAKPSEIYFTSGGTESDNWALVGGAYAQKAKGRTRVVVSAVEHHAVLESAEKLKKEGFEIVYLPVNDGGRVALNALETLIDDNTAIVALMAANNETGVLQPISQAEKIAHEKGALFFTDAVQFAPYRPLDVKTLNADLLSFSSHKFFGPKGCGVLYIKSGVKIEKFTVGGEQERGLRGGTTNVPSVVGFAAAYERTCASMQARNAHLQALKTRFLQKLSMLDGVHINGGGEETLAAVLNVRFDGIRNEDFLFNMDLHGVCVAAGSACASASIKPSHVLTAMGLSERVARASIRFSFGKANTLAEIDRAAEWTVETVKKLRKF